MRYLGIGAFCAAMMCVPAQGATITQWDTRFYDFGFQYFDSSLGTLESVNLTIDPNFRRAFRILTQSSEPQINVAWDASNENYCFRGVCQPLVAAGSTDVTLTYSEGLRAFYGYVTVDFSGSQLSLDLDPSSFIQTNPYRRNFMTVVDPGLYDESLADIFTASGATVTNATNILCNNSYRGCDNSRYTLTYNYIPGGVPEPSTWAMLILGFGAVGSTLRRHRRQWMCTVPGI